VRLRIFNTLGREIQEIRPIEEGRIGMYACGLTVYNFAHIGNLRTYVFEDILRRILEYQGFEVEHVMNVTDVGHLTDDADQGEDKMLKSAREKKKSVWEIAEFYTDAFFGDLDRLNIEMPTVVCRATDHIEDMIRLIQRLEQRGLTYSSGSNVYFDISKFSDYGKLGLLDLGELKAGARIRVDQNKRNPHDFVLWFTKSKFEHQAMLWDSPWGKGYPGWHIECSAMSMKYLGEHFDIHCGGVDHISVHHTNEIAQSEGAAGKKWVNYWVHGEHLLMETEKMSKSKGEFLTLSELVDRGYDPMDYRYFLLGAHYRTQLQFSYEALEAAKNARARLHEHIVQLKEQAGSPNGEGSDVPRSPLDEDTAETYLGSFEEHASTDMNMPRCLSELWGLVRDESVGAKSKLRVIGEMDRILGLRLLEVEIGLPELDDETKALISEREEARKSRDFARADEIRDSLKKQGIILEDTPNGVRWKRV
jgi:cysteinyl-tRNA synthetase